MEALGVTRDNGKLYWHGREMAEEVIREFIAAADVKDAYPFLFRIPELGLRVYHFDYDIEQDGFHIKLYCNGVYDLVDIRYFMQSDGAEYFVAHNNIEFVGDEDDIDDIPDIQPQLNCLADLAANKQRVRELERDNAEMAARITALNETIAALQADIAERKLRPGGEEYEAARERFTTQTYE